ncbi:uncharacterized protein LOC135077203 [Ostrinia nubilalis]|uniref:uncharacterized protein LOC135077203 n=1 Tax=Ostrinia nubilalis TaxID=29057 RepID=UPI00308227BC
MAAGIIEISEQCIADVGVDPEVMAILRRTEVPDTNQYKRVPEFVYCAYNRCGLCEDNGRVKIDKILDIYPSSSDKEAIRKLMVDCDKMGNDPIDTIFKYVKCFYGFTPEKLVF